MVHRESVSGNPGTASALVLSLAAFVLAACLDLDGGARFPPTWRKRRSRAGRQRPAGVLGGAERRSFCSPFRAAQEPLQDVCRRQAGAARHQPRSVPGHHCGPSGPQWCRKEYDDGNPHRALSTHWRRRSCPRSLCSVGLHRRSQAAWRVPAAQCIVREHHRRGAPSPILLSQVSSSKASSVRSGCSAEGHWPHTKAACAFQGTQRRHEEEALHRHRFSRWLQGGDAR
mmetsp:Transcript_14859/g.23591  ORF Transcript_14859/g.23591 Transcript_14859/m.23591 type:complete len:228 (+) Transcript_14859:1682-2365(+)